MTTTERRPLNAKVAKIAKDIVFLCVLGGLCVVVVAAAPPVRTMYNDAYAREQAVRAALTAQDRSHPTPEGAKADAPQTRVEDVRAVVAAYEAVVRRYPASGYCDNALWQAAHLALDTFNMFGQLADRDTGIKLLRKLAVMYPTSKLARQVSGELARIAADASLAPGGHVDPPLQAAARGSAGQEATPRAGADPQAAARVRADQRVVLQQAQDDLEQRRRVDPEQSRRVDPEQSRRVDPEQSRRVGPSEKPTLATIRDIRRSVERIAQCLLEFGDRFAGPAGAAQEPAPVVHDVLRVGFKICV